MSLVIASNTDISMDPRLSSKAREWVLRRGGGDERYNLPMRDPNHYGIYMIKGEDPNCDFGGSHREPDLGYLEGPLWAVINEAVELSGFFSYGGGGKVLLVVARKVRAAMTSEEVEDIEKLKTLETAALALRKSLSSKRVLSEDM
jgi:hypothetical protein